MISSEVQRTLVKSPPELWAELSDPATLARHLSELGEIRITRIDPEHAVEWEAEDATGSVRIKPSGWGTKVTLTVTRRTPEVPRETAQMSEGRGEAEVPEGAGEAQVPEGPREMPESGLPVHPEPAASAREAEAEPEAAGETVLELPVDAEPVAIAGAEREAGVDVESENEAEAEPAVTGESEREAAVEAEPETITGSQPEDQQGASEALEEHEQDPRSESRRGFFARLFRRKSAEAEAEAESEPPIATVWSLPEPSLSEPSDAGATRQQAPEPAWAIATPRRAPEQLGSGGPPESPEAVEPPEPGEPPESVEALETAEAFRSVTTADPVETIDALDRVDVVDGVNAAETIDAPREVDALEVTECDDASHDLETVEAVSEHAEARTADISAELRAAEEVEAEEVTAVLTEVLDRLGAAHHRPFSRS